MSRDSKKPFVFKKNGISISFSSENGNKELLQKIFVEELKGNPAGSIKAFRFYPEGMKFNNPLEIAIPIPENEIPYRIKKDSLRLAYYENGSWKIIKNSKYDTETSSIVGSISHFSIYGIVSTPSVFSGKGKEFSANGVLESVRDNRPYGQKDAWLEGIHI